MRPLTFIAATAAALALALSVAPVASAASCSDKKPGTLSPGGSFGLSGGRVQLREGEGARQTIRYEYRVAGCQVLAKTYRATVLGPSEERGVTARLVGKGSNEVTLVVDFAKNTLDAGDYELSVISRGPGLALTQPVNVDVKAAGALPWLLALVSLVLGILVLALRSAASSGEPWLAAIAGFFKPQTFTGPLIGGAGGVWAALKTAYIDNDVWFATEKQVALLVGTAVAAVIAVGTVGAITQEGIKKARR